MVEIDQVDYCVTNLPYRYDGKSRKYLTHPNQVIWITIVNKETGQLVWRCGEKKIITQEYHYKGPAYILNISNCENSELWALFQVDMSCDTFDFTLTNKENNYFNSDVPSPLNKIKNITDFQNASSEDADKYNNYVNDKFRILNNWRMNGKPISLNSEYIQNLAGEWFDKSFHDKYFVIDKAKKVEKRFYTFQQLYDPNKKNMRCLTYYKIWQTDNGSGTLKFSLKNELL